MSPRLLHRCAPWLALALFVGLALPPVNWALNVHMSTQMLVQIPLLVVVGYLLRGSLPRWLAAAIGRWNGNGIPGVLLASFGLAFWMLPRWMDAAVTLPLVTVAKFITVPLLVGLPLGRSWPRMNFVARGVVYSELLAMCFRIGWLYLSSPVQVCGAYMIADQQRYGRLLIAIGAALVLWIAYKLFFGHFRSLSTE